MAEDKSMGELFNQRRAAKQHERDSGVPKILERPKTFLEIQAEQERERRMRSNEQARREPGNRGGGRRSSHNDRSGLPLEQGTISTIKDSFGFIYCANREDKIFFHFSEVRGCHPADLQMDDEVEFRVGQSRNEDRPAAFEVKRLEPGTVVWEVEDEPGERFQGIVERPIRLGRGSDSSQMTEGTIRMLVVADEVNEEESVEVAAAATGPLVRFLSQDILRGDTNTAEEGGQSARRMDSDSFRRGPRLTRNDLVEFSLVTSLRSKNRYAKQIKILQTERERQRLDKEKELLANGRLEKGVVTTLKSDYGFIRSNRRRDEVYFHYSSIELPDDDNNGDENNDKHQEDADGHVLKEGQDLEFVVVTEPGGNGKKEKISARKVKFLKRGSVEFEVSLAEGVTGQVTRCPSPSDKKSMGSIRLSTPIKDLDDGQERHISEVSFAASDAPGGVYSLGRDGLQGIWVREGDTFLFDVVKELVDGRCIAVPTAHTVPALNDEVEPEAGKGKAIRFVSTTLVGRTQGVVHAIKDGFGFVSCAERAVDAYFKMYELFPEPIQADLRKHKGVNTIEPVVCEIGTEVEFDLWVQRTPAGASRSRRGQNQDKENLKAQRLLLLPPGTITQTKVIAKDVPGIVAKEDLKQLYAGMIDLAEEHKQMSHEERHPLATDLIRSLLQECNDTGDARSLVVYPDVQSSKEDDVIIHLVETLGAGKLVCSHLPIAGEKKYPGRLQISTVAEKPKGNEGPEPEAGSKVTDEKGEVITGNEGDEEQGSDEQVNIEHKSETKRKRKKKRAHPKPIKTVRFDKHCLSKELQDELPLALGDRTLCDVNQSRRTGMVSLSNVRVVERANNPDDNDVTESAVGIVSEVASQRQFGFIVAIDEHATKRENLFFHFKHVAKDDNESARPVILRKGDEVKFDVAVAKNGKRTAVNIHRLTKGTLEVASKPHKNACHGYILMEPSHTSLSDTPFRQKANPKSVSPKRGGRWEIDENVDEPKKGKNAALVKEEGCLLLIKDPSNMFRKVTATATTEQGGEVEEEPSAGMKHLLSHLNYKAGAVALVGVGSTSATESSQRPKRGDLVSFVKAKSGQGVRDIRVVKKREATFLRGRLESIKISQGVGSAVFVAATGKEEKYEIDLKEVVSCDPSLLKENEAVEGILHDGAIFGVCRSADLYLDSKLGASHKERPRLNLTVRKGLGGKIMAQSMMAKGPDRSNGFATGWTQRTSKFAESEPRKV